MATTARRLGWLGALALAAGCESSTAPGAGDAQDEVMRATDAMRDFGEYVVYVNAIMTDQLTPQVASEYGIVRSKNRALLTVSVHRKAQGGRTIAVKAPERSASAVNLTAQLRQITLREISEAEGEAIYYIGETAINNEESLIFTVELTPEGSSMPLSLRYQKQFFVSQ